MKIKFITKNDVVISKNDFDEYHRLVDVEKENKKLKAKLDELTERFNSSVAQRVKLESNLKNSRKIAFDLSEESLKYRQQCQQHLITIKKLKALCTRNKIDYKSLIEKDEDKNGKGRKGTKTEKTL